MRRWSVMVAAVASCLVVVGCSNSGDAGDVGGGEDVATEPVVGACLEDNTVLAAGGTPDDLTFVGCNEEHEAEIGGVVALDGDEYPGPEGVGPRLGECPDLIASYLEDPGMAYDDGQFVPDEAAWEAGHRSILCLVVSPGAETYTEPVGSADG